MWQLFLREHLFSIIYTLLSKQYNRSWKPTSTLSDIAGDISFLIDLWSMSVTTHSSYIGLFFFFFKWAQSKIRSTLQACHGLTVYCPLSINMRKYWVGNPIKSHSSFCLLLFNARGRNDTPHNYGTDLFPTGLIIKVILKNKFK